ncbi:MAG: rhodanese-like domain-containing protein [Gammaproteobacteria bacterium]|nr:rhodanese-like domain-containing protein [Gammaproteobacteria bacterium]
MTTSKLPTAEEGAYAGDITPLQSWDMLEVDANAILLDVRTDAEFAYVGFPDLERLGKKTIFVSWVLFPDSRLNADFLGQINKLTTDKKTPLLFLCRSGVRSRYAAAEATRSGYHSCYNILEGFEGDKDSIGHRGKTGGWKVAGLPWLQE